jgi:hypothetical protein
MQYPNIVALVDARIALLQQARDLLATPSTESAEPSPKRAKRLRQDAAAPSPSQAETSPAIASESSPAQAAPPEPVRLPFIAPRGRSGARKKAAPAEAPSALGGHLPTGPVFVSAARIQAEEAQRKSADEETLPARQEAAVEPNEILRRWREAQHASNP